jgi:Protein of unknown function (DUF2844)
MSVRRLLYASILVGSATTLSVPSYAELGGTLASVRIDTDRMAGRTASTEMGTYTHHIISRINGGTVHELTNVSGQVFAVTWSGPGKPDLRSVLGRYFATFQTANETPGRIMHSLRRPPQVSQSDLQIQTEGHMGWYRGVAFIPSLAPRGFATSDLTREP